MQHQLPVVDDTVVWDAWLAMYQTPALSVALELDIFELLDAQPDCASGLAARRDFDERGLSALLPVLKQLGFLQQHAGKYQLSEAGRHYMLKSSPFSWASLFSRVSKTIVAHKLLLETINGEREAAKKSRPADGWESGHVDMGMAVEVTAFMHSHSMPAAAGLAQTSDFSGVRRLLDVGGGSGCFSINLAQNNPQLHCTVMELPTICALVGQYVSNAQMSEQVDTISVDMFRGDWPADYDAHFFSNIFHDWKPETCLQLAKSSYAALPAGGKIFLHEMLLDDSAGSPAPAVLFSLLMAMGTKGQQFTFPQLQELLISAGFKNVQARHSYGYYSLVSAEK